jgi:hypothetical protein
MQQQAAAVAGGRGGRRGAGGEGGNRVGGGVGGRGAGVGAREAGVEEEEEQTTSGDNCKVGGVECVRRGWGLGLSWMYQMGGVCMSEGEVLDVMLPVQSDHAISACIAACELPMLEVPRACACFGRDTSLLALY